MSAQDVWVSRGGLQLCSEPVELLGNISLSQFTVPMRIFLECDPDTLIIIYHYISILQYFTYVIYVNYLHMLIIIYVILCICIPKKLYQYTHTAYMYTYMYCVCIKKCHIWIISDKTMGYRMVHLNLFLHAAFFSGAEEHQQARAATATGCRWTTPTASARSLAGDPAGDQNGEVHGSPGRLS